jgi:CDP-diacylglycerol--serine O-phosphatidyltransferase
LRSVSLADAVTLANALCGFAAIVVAARAWTDAPADGPRLSSGQLVLAAALIVAGGLLDTVDGAVARRRGGSPLGEHLEEMSDVVSFGVAVPILFAVSAVDYGRPWSWLALVVAAGYAAAVMLRLARYAATPAGEHGRKLTGLPSPPAASAAVSVIVLQMPAPLALAGMAGIAVLMLASFPFPRVSAATVPIMAVWWGLAALAAVGPLPTWPVAAVTLAGIAVLLLSVPVLSGRGEGGVGLERKPGA